MKESTEHFGREAEIDAIGNRGNDAADSMFGVRGIFGARGGPSITLPNHHFFRAFLSRAASNKYIIYKRYASLFCLFAFLSFDLTRCLPLWSSPQRCHRYCHRNRRRTYRYSLVNFRLLTSFEPRFSLLLLRAVL